MVIVPVMYIIPPRMQRTEQRRVRQDAGTSVSDQQMNCGTPHYPVDRYLVECSNKFEMVNIMGGDIWNAEPALRPEDEIILRKLHDMLQSTADDLKLLSGELSKYHEPGVQVKSSPTPLDEDFNEKVHIEEIVNAKFHGYKVVGKSSQSTPTDAQKDTIQGIVKSITAEVHKPRKVISTGIQVNQMPIQKKITKKSNLAVTKTNVVQINDNFIKINNDSRKNMESQRQEAHKPTVAYNEVSFKNIEPKVKELQRKPLQVQIMPSINIRSQLKEQKVLDLNIEPEFLINGEKVTDKSNIAVISIQHKPVTFQETVPSQNHNHAQVSMLPTTTTTGGKEPIRKVFKMSSCESSESTYSAKNIGKTITSERVPCKQPSEIIKHKASMASETEFVKHSHSNLVEWRKKLNSLYGYPKSSRRVRTSRSERKSRPVELKPSTVTSKREMNNNRTLNNTEYIPYSKLTLGGVRISDIEKQLSDIPNNNDIALSPILDTIFSRQNSFEKVTPIKIPENSPEILTISDENLLQEVLDIEKKVHKTLSKNLNEISVPFEKTQHSKDVEDQDSYIDDFEEDKSDYAPNNKKQNQSSDEDIISGKSSNGDNERESVKSLKEKTQSKTFVKRLNLSFKNKVDTFEFIHSVDTQETGTQSNSTQKISLKETQTSPRNDKCNVQPIYNDLWLSVDSKREVEKLFQLEKEFIKKLIVDEYGDLMEENLNKPSTSKVDKIIIQNNVVSSQKNTQTSPAHVKNIMTSPTRTKTRTTSPQVAMTVDRHTSPLAIETVEINVADGNDLAISINLSSPRFNLRLPQSSCEVLSNTESHVQSKKNTIENITRGPGTFRKNAVSSSSSVEGDYSSSDISSLGEVRFKIKKRLRKLQVPSISELSSSLSLSKCSSDISDAILPMRSEGEVSLGQVYRKPSKQNHSEGEMSLGRL